MVVIVDSVSNGMFLFGFLVDNLWIVVGFVVGYCSRLRGILGGC